MCVEKMRVGSDCRRIKENAKKKSMAYLEVVQQDPVNDVVRKLSIRQRHALWLRTQDGKMAQKWMDDQCKTRKMLAKDKLYGQKVAEVQDVSQPRNRKNWNKDKTVTEVQDVFRPGSSGIQQKEDPRPFPEVQDKFQPGSNGIQQKEDPRPLLDEAGEAKKWLADWLQKESTV
jgi:hypothetical protein